MKLLGENDKQKEMNWKIKLLIKENEERCRKISLNLIKKIPEI